MGRNLWLSAMAVIISVLVYYALGPWAAKWIVDSLVLGVAAGMTWTWTAAAVKGLSDGAQTGADKIVITIWMAWLMYCVQRAYTLIAAALDRPDWLVNSVVPQIIATFIFLAGVYGLAAPVETPRRALPAAVVSGWFVTGIVTGATAVYLVLTTGL